MRRRHRLPIAMTGGRPHAPVVMGMAALGLFFLLCRSIAVAAAGAPVVTDVTPIPAQQAPSASAGSAAALPAIPLAANALPEHARLALAATAGRIIGVPAARLRPVEFSRAAEANFAKLPMRPVGFAVKRLVLTKVTRATRSRTPRFGLDGAFVLQTPGGRRARVGFSVKYAFTQRRFMIELAELRPLLPPHAQVAFAVLPGTVAEAALRPAPPIFEAALAQVLDRAYRTDTPPAQLPSPAEYVLVAAFLDWLPATVPVAVWVSADKAAVDLPQQPEVPTIWDFGGWRIYLLRVSLNPADPQPKYAKIGWSPLAADGKAAPTGLLGVFPLPHRS